MPEQYDQNAQKALLTANGILDADRAVAAAEAAQTQRMLERGAFVNNSTLNQERAQAVVDAAATQVQINAPAIQPQQVQQATRDDNGE